MPPKAHTISVTLDNKKEYITANFPSPVRLGDTVICSSKDGGEVEIYFDVNGSPFLNLTGGAKTEIDSNDPPQELKVPGDFTGRCYLQTPNGVLHTYDPDVIRPHTLGGGDMIVR